MSQFIFRAGKDLECQVGWDPALQTFYGQVYKTDEDGRVDVYEENGEEKDGTIHWVGTSPGEIKTVEELQDRLKPVVQILPRDAWKKLPFVPISAPPMKVEERPLFPLLNTAPSE